MTSQHTKQLLRVVSGAIETESGIPIAHMDRCHGNGTTPVERDDTAARMVLAYNSLNEKEAVMRQTTEYTAYFDHTSGGDGLLPLAHRGYYDLFSVTIKASDTDEAEEKAMAAMYDDRSDNHPDFVNRAVDDLAVRLYYDTAGEKPAN